MLQKKSALPKSAYAFLAFYFLLLAATALHSRVELYDSFENLNSSISISAGRSLFYSHLRPPVTPILLLPGIIFSRWLQDPWLGVILSRLTILFWALLGFAAFFQVLRRKFSVLLAFYTTAALALNPLVIMMAIAIKEDIPAMALLTLGGYLYLERRWKSALFFLALAGWARWNNLIVPGAVIFGQMALDWLFHRKKNIPLPILLGACIGPFLLLFGLAAILYPWMGVSSLTGGISLFLQQARQLFLNNAYRHEPAQLYLYALAYSVSVPLLLLMGVGIRESLRQRSEEDFYFLSWFAVFFLLLFILISHREPRYILCMLPPMYYFLAAGLNWVEKRTSLAKRWIFIGLAIYPLFYAGKFFVQRWNDPIFSLPFEQAVSDYAKQLAQGQKIWWRGTPFALVPSDVSFCPYDTVTNVFHFDAHVVSYYTGDLVNQVRSPNELDFDVLKTGDVIILNNEGYMTAELFPSRRLPLLVFKVKRFEANVKGGAAHTEAPAGEYFLFGREKDSNNKTLFRGMVRVANGTIQNFQAEKFPEATALHLIGEVGLAAFKTPN